MNWWCSNEFHELWINELWQWISCLSYAQCKEVIPLSWNSSLPAWIHWITPMCYERGTKPPASFSIHEFALATGSEGDIWSLYMKDQVPGKKNIVCACVCLCVPRTSVFNCKVKILQTVKTLANPWHLYYQIFKKLHS